jgi:hypothetical protein
VEGLIKVMGLLGDGQEMVWAPAERGSALGGAKSRIFLSILGVSIRFSVVNPFWLKYAF